MRAAVVASLATSVLAARPFLNEPDTGIDEVLSNITAGTLAPLNAMVGLPDFEWAARKFLPAMNYTYYSNGAAGEWSSRNNVEAFHRYTWRPRQMVDVTGIPETLPTSILGFNFSAPIFISPCARGAYGNPEAELNLVKGAGAGEILYVASDFSNAPVTEIMAAKAEGQTVFQQIYLSGNITRDGAHLQEVERAGADALVITIDSAASSIRHRAMRYGVASANTALTRLDWNYWNQLKNFTSLPMAAKGATSVETIKGAVENGVPAIVISNHGGRNLDGSPGPLEVMLELHEQAPELLDQIEIWADGGVRYGGDVLKLLALGVKAVGVGRPYMFANIFGTAGIEKVTQILKQEIIVDAGNLGVPSLEALDSTYVNWKSNNYLG
ncbi:hydroxyacid oxidase [Plectosphaerella cucumerina]|uniref:Hydroxyacid oxidase n=1 Tax=Plectosphaerella cucumerina TaxID=40658 RepID=A0A8K0TFR3_9PEZI|nr:hydroxyacid oxidase [Plectosphaerella cucumerina]